jgi:hypothetical protein
MSDALRAAMADLAEEVENVDLLNRTLKESHRLRVRRLVTGTVAAAALVVMTGSAALALHGTGQRNPEPYASVAPATSTDDPNASPDPTKSAGGASHSPPASSGSPAAGNSAASGPIPSSAMLQAGDVPNGTGSDDDNTGDHGSLSATMAYCNRYPASWENRARGAAERKRTIDTNDEARYAMQATSRQQQAGVLEKLIPDARAAFNGPCATVAIGGNPSDTVRYTILSSAWGDESLFMHGVSADGGTRDEWRILIRRGNVITEIRTELPGLTEAQARQIGQKAAQRLCEAIPNC